MGLRAREKERDRERGGNHETMGEREEERDREGVGFASRCVVTYKFSIILNSEPLEKKKSWYI